MLEGQSILCISSIDWDFIWQGHQQIMATLAEDGNKVLFVENTGVRRPRFRDVPRLRQRVRNWWLIIPDEVTIIFLNFVQRRIAPINIMLFFGVFIIFICWYFGAGFIVKLTRFAHARESIESPDFPLELQNISH